MEMSEGVEWAAHCATLLAMIPPGQSLPASRLAEYHDVPAAYLAKHLQALARAGVVSAERGPGGGYCLARPAADISLLEIVEAIDGTEPAFKCTEIRRRGPTASGARNYSPMCGIHAAMARADLAWRAELRETSVARLAEGALRDASPVMLDKGARWLGEVLP